MRGKFVGRSGGIAERRLVLAGQTAEGGPARCSRLEAQEVHPSEVVAGLLLARRLEGPRSALGPEVAAKRKDRPGSQSASSEVGGKRCRPHHTVR
jgi:hypothetical protein